MSFNSITTVNGKRCTLVKRTASASSPAVAQTVSPQATSAPPNVQAAVASSPPQSLVQGSLSPSSIAGAVHSSKNSPSLTGSRSPTPARSSARTPKNSSGASVFPDALPDFTVNTTRGATAVAVLPNSSSGAVATQSTSRAGSSSNGSSPGSSHPGSSGPQQNQHHGGSKAGMVAGIISGLILVVLLVALVRWFMKRGKRRRDRDSMGTPLIKSEKSHFEHGQSSRPDNPWSPVLSKISQLKAVILAAGVALSARFSRDREQDGWTWPESPERAEKRATSPTPVDTEGRDQPYPAPGPPPSPPTNIPTLPPLASKPSFRARASRVIATIPKAPFNSRPKFDSFDRRDWFGQVPPPKKQPTLSRASLVAEPAHNQSDPFQDPPLRSRRSNPFEDPSRPEWPLASPPPESPSPSRPVSPLTPHEAHLATTNPIYDPLARYSPLPNPFTDAASSHHAHTPSAHSAVSAVSNASSDLLDHWRRDTTTNQGPLSPLVMSRPTTSLNIRQDLRDTVMTYDSIRTARSDPFDLEPGMTRSMNLDSVVSARPSLMKVDTVKSIGVRRVGRAAGVGDETEGRRSSEVLTDGDAWRP